MSSATLFKICGLSMILVLTHGVDDNVNGAQRRDGALSDFQRRAKRKDLDPQTCVDNFDVQRDKIIRTEESREMGAKYLNELDVGSREECLRLCCETDTCDVFVFEEKSPGSCYLFNCGPPEDFKCKFTRHTNFSSAVMSVDRHIAELRDQERLTKHEQDLAGLRKQPAGITQPLIVASTARPINAHTPPPPTQSYIPARRCSRFQFECHSGLECIAIYNACDGIPQCADGSDEAPELGCPPAPTPPPVKSQAPVPGRDLIVPDRLYDNEDEVALKKIVPADPQGPFIRPAQMQVEQWPHRLTQAQPQQQLLKPYQDNSASSRIFSHKGGLLTESDSMQQQQYMPYDAVQEAQWPHRQWPQQMPMEQMPMNEHQIMYHYPQETIWKQNMQMPMQNSMENPKNTMQIVGQVPILDKMEGQASMPDRDKMWAVPQTPVMKMKTMPETPVAYVKQPPTNEDEPKKGPAYHTKKKNIKHQEADETETVDSDVETEESDSVDKNDEKVKDTLRKNIKTQAANKTKKKHLKEDETANADEVTVTEVAVDKKKDDVNKHKHGQFDKFQMTDDDHDGLSEKPPGAILLLILGVLMTSVMVVMLVCKLKVARRRMRRGGKSPFAHDADYLVNANNIKENTEVPCMSLDPKLPEL